jgi:methionine-rich copper-binding protein CopC
VFRAAVRAAVPRLTLLIALLGAPLPAAAHAIVLESSPKHDAVLPEAPARLLLRFNSRIEAALSRVTLESAGGRPVALPVAGTAAGAADRLVVPLQPLAPGVYVVRYRVLAADGHVTEGALRFTIKAP